MATFSATDNNGELMFQSRDGHHTSLIELYTSEGCSSCPPADDWLNRLISSPRLWTDIVPVAFHVDYWDKLGWPDGFASPVATTRQRAYARNWGSSNSLYTPGFVLDGREWKQWSSFDVRNKLPIGGTGRLTAIVHDQTKTVTVDYQTSNRATAAHLVSVALLGCDLSSNVKAGENRGRHLRHDFVVLAFETKLLPPADTTTSFVWSEAQFIGSNAQRRLALAVWVEEVGRGVVEQATGGWLASSYSTDVSSLHDVRRGSTGCNIL